MLLPGQPSMTLLDASTHWNGIDLRTVVERTGTPALLLSERRLLANARELRAGLQSGWPKLAIRYCAKANPEPRILELIRAEGFEVMAAHELEVRLAVSAGFAPTSIAYQRPVLDGDEVARVIDAGVRRFHAFRPADLDLLSAAAVRAGAVLRVSLRVATRRSAIPFLGRSGRRLGFDADSLDDAVISLPRGGIVIDALNSYCGTQQVAPDAYRAEIRTLVAAAALLRRRGVDIGEINLGGGVPSHSLGRRTSLRGVLGIGGGRPKLELREFASRLAGLFAAEAGRLGGDVTLGLEPGRSLVGNSMVLLTRVRAVQGAWRFLDEGRNVLVESPLVFARPMQPLESRSGSAVVHLSGPTLNTLDVVEHRRRLPTLQAGDVLAIGDAGAYCLSRGTRYAGLLPAVWAAAENGTLTCIRPADRVEDFAG